MHILAKVEQRDEAGNERLKWNHHLPLHYLPVFQLPVHNISPADHPSEINVPEDFDYFHIYPSSLYLVSNPTILINTTFLQIKDSRQYLSYPEDIPSMYCFCFQAALTSWMCLPCD